MVIGWIKNHILSSNNGRNRQLEESELKVQQSPQKHCNPDSYLNKRPKPLKILKIIPIQYRLPSWKSFTSRRNCTSNSSSLDSIDMSQHAKENVKERTKKVASPLTSHKSKLFCQQMLPETKNTRSSTKSSSPKEEILDVNIPMMKFPRKISNTFPKMSPSRRIRNTNLVLPPCPKIEFSKDIEDMCNDDYNSDDSEETSVLKERTFTVDRTTEIEDLINVDVIIDERRENGQKNLSFGDSQAVTTPLSTSYEESKFCTYRVKSIRKFHQTSKVVKIASNTSNVKRRLFTCSPKYTQKFSQDHVFSSAIIEGAPKEKILSSSILEKSLIFENESMNVSNKSENIRRSKKISPNLLERTFTFEKSSTHNSFQDSSNPIDFELPLRSKQLNRKKNIVREIVPDFDEEVKESLHPIHSHDDKERFVKEIVNVLEEGNISGIGILSSLSSINDEDSPSESETKSYVTSSSPKDTDYSDYSRKSPTLNSNYDQTFNIVHLKEDTLKDEEKKKKCTDDDTVLWISIPRCTLPRSSSPLSTISISPSRYQSPGISPIKSPNEVEYLLQTNSGAIYKTSNALTKKLFHETVVLDSGYSD